MPRSDENVRHICGNTMFRRFAYVHKKDNQKFGLLEATDKANAREYLGRDFLIKETWLSVDEETMSIANREVKRDIVSRMIPGMVGPCEECNATDDYSRLLRENKDLKQQLEDLMLASRVEIVELQRKSKKPEKKTRKNVFEFANVDQIEIAKLKAYACSYSNCLWSHCMSKESNARDTNMLFNHAQYVTRNTEECWQFLKSRGVPKVDWKHCQYFFAICWPIYKPWQELNRHVLGKLLEDGTLKSGDIPGNPFADTRPLFAAST